MCSLLFTVTGMNEPRSVYCRPNQHGGAPQSGTEITWMVAATRLRVFSVPAVDS